MLYRPVRDIPPSAIKGWSSSENRLTVEAGFFAYLVGPIATSRPALQWLHGRPARVISNPGALTMATEPKDEIIITPDMLAAGLQVLVDSGLLDNGRGRELPTGADEELVADIYKAMARARR